jgi:hypothetical protein
MALSHSPQIIRNGLVAYWDFANSKSYNVSNIKNIITGYDGVFYNSPTFLSENNGVMSFDGSNDYALLDMSSDITGSNLQTITVSVWIKYSTTSPGYPIAINRNTGYSTLISLSINQSNDGAQSIGNIGFLTRNNADTAHGWLLHYGPYNDNNWYNLIAVIDGMSRKLYINGMLVNSDTNFGMQSVIGNTARISFASHGGGSPIAIKFSNAMIYNVALSTDEIKQNFNALRGRYGI